MTEEAASSLQDVLVKFVGIADVHYRGKIHDNVLNVFNDLSDEDKKTFLRGVLHIHALVIGEIESPLQCIPVHVIPVNGTTEGVQVVTEPLDNEIAELNKKQMIQLKGWLVKTTSVIVLLSFAVLVISAFLSYGEINTDVLSMFGKTGTILSTVFGN